jgi:hypothetical protein
MGLILVCHVLLLSFSGHNPDLHPTYYAEILFIGSAPLEYLLGGWELI